MKLSHYVNSAKVTLCFALTNFVIEIGLCQNVTHTCFSNIYCYGPLLHMVQMAKIYRDSKTFVDMKMKQPPKVTMTLFKSFMENYRGKEPSVGEVKKFVNQHFESAGQEFEAWNPEDWKPHPKFVDKIKDTELRKWALRLNARWKILGRKLKAKVKENEDLYSIIWVPHPVIVPGGRFREFYYWDSYWIVQGLLHSEMHKTVQGMLKNFLYIVEKYGHIPNGGRIYYIARSQPPLLIPMIKLYLDFTADKNFISQNLRTMEKEFDYWMTDHSVKVTVKGIVYTLAKYGDKSRGPRPESYSEDVESAKMFNDAKKEMFYSELKAAAESGWDFSSRWFIDSATNRGNLTSTSTRSIIPVDLNSILYWNAKLLAEFHLLGNNNDKAQEYSRIAEEWKRAVTAVLWHENIGAWLDYDMQNGVSRNYFYSSNIAPLWTGCYSDEDTEVLIPRVIKYLRKNDALSPGGIPTSHEATGEQWDYPNAWPPLQHIIIVGLNQTGDAIAGRVAFEIARRWVHSNYKGFEEKGVMYEKYDATAPGVYGGGGEYEIQLGFGWTNGVIMDLLSRYSDRLRAHDPEIAATTAPGVIGNIILMVTASVLCRMF